MTDHKDIIDVFSPSLQIDLLGAATGQRLILPFYHTVSDLELPHLKHLYPVKNCQLFKNDLNFLLKNYVTVDLPSLIDHVSRKDILYQNSFFLSFDDGLAEIYHVIAPVLLRLGIPAVFFVNPAFVDNKDLFYRYKASLLIDALQKKRYSEAVLQQVINYLPAHSSLSLQEKLLHITYQQQYLLDDIAQVLGIDFSNYLKRQKPYLTLEQLHILRGHGFIIGAHSMDHPQYSMLSLEDQLEQTKRSVEWVKTTFNQPHAVFAFPFTDHQVSKDFFTSVFDPQQPVVDLSFGTAGMKHDMFRRNLQRIPMERKLQSAEAIILKEYLYYIAKFPFGKNTIRRA